MLQLTSRPPFKAPSLDSARTGTSTPPVVKPSNIVNPLQRVLVSMLVSVSVLVLVSVSV